MNSVKLTFTARNEAEATAICAAVERAKKTVSGGADEEILVRTDGGGCPAGHTYRALCSGLRRGLLDARRTTQGLVFTRTALEAFEQKLAEAHTEKQQRDRERRGGNNVTSLNDHRVAALTKAGLRERQVTR